MKKHFSEDAAIDLAELFVEKEKVDKKLEKLELNRKKRNERKELKKEKYYVTYN